MILMKKLLFKKFPVCIFSICLGLCYHWFTKICLHIVFVFFCYKCRIKNYLFIYIKYYRIIMHYEWIASVCRYSLSHNSLMDGRDVAVRILMAVNKTMDGRRHLPNLIPGCHVLMISPTMTSVNEVHRLANQFILPFWELSF